MEQRNLEFQRITIKTLSQIHQIISDLNSLGYGNPTDHPITGVLNNIINLEATNIGNQDKIIELLKAHQNLLLENKTNNYKIKQSLYYLGIAIKQLQDKIDRLTSMQK